MAIRVPHNRLTYGEEEVQAVSDVVRSGLWAGGNKVRELESSLAKKAGVDHVACVSSGLSALTLALRGMEIGEGDEVIIPAYSFVAMVNCILAVGATPILADVRESDWNIDPESVRKVHTPRTKIIVVVNTFGAPAPIPELQNINGPILEDCAHGFGVQVDGGLLGARSEASILSFYATKPMGAGEGGAVLSNQFSIIDTVKANRDYDDLEPAAHRHNDKMNDLEASVALAQLARLDGFIQARQQIAERYYEKLRYIAEETGAFSLPDPTTKRFWYRYIVHLHNAPVETYSAELAELGIAAIRPVKDWRRNKTNDFPHADEGYTYCLSIPLYPTLTQEEQDAVCEALETVAKKYS